MDARFRILLPSSVFVLSLGLSAQAQDGEPGDSVAEEEVSFDGETERCISVRSIRDTEIVDDRTILFYMRRRDLIYRNDLDSRCPGLARSGRMAYTARGGRLCDVDVITVADPFNRRFDTGIVCRLGNFRPISPDAAERLIGDIDEANDDEGLVITEVELPQTDDGTGEIPEADDGGDPESPQVE
jgi:hypothetical protein